jgi:hypothetical protein
MDKLIRIAIGAVVIVLSIGVVYGLVLLHTALGLSGTHYLYIGGTVAISYIAYIIGDIIMVGYKTRGKE